MGLMIVLKFFGIPMLFGIPSAIVAGFKGFKSLRWLIAFGLLGLIVVALMPSAKTQGISEEEALLRAEKANNIGLLMACLNFSLFILIVSVTFTYYAMVGKF